MTGIGRVDQRLPGVEPSLVDPSAQTAYSDPGAWAGLFDEIEPTIEAVSLMSRNVVAHYRAQADALPESSAGDINLRWVEAVLATDQRRHRAPLKVERAVGDRVQGCCRDHSLLAVAALRHHGVAARSRVGFATYLSPTWNADHVIVEAWMDDRWRWFDPEFAGNTSVQHPALPDPSDISPGRDSPFLTAARVWLGHRAESLDVSLFGVAEGSEISGDWFVFVYVLLEVAHRFGDELLLWDTWGAMTNDLSSAPPENLRLVDEVAQLLVRADDGDLGAERDLLGRYGEDDRLRPGSTIGSLSPLGEVYEVDLTARTSRVLEA